MTDHAEGADAAPRTKRLAGLWVICVWLGLIAMVDAAAAVQGTPLGVAALGLRAALGIGCAVGLWRRWYPTLFIVTGLMGILCTIDAVGYARGAMGKEVRYLVPIAFRLLILTYLWFRRRHFRLPAEQRPRLLSAHCLTVGCVVLTLGLCVGLLLAIDDAPREFPLLVVEDLSVPDVENGFPVLERMLAAMPPWVDSEQQKLLLRTAPEDADEPDEWYWEAEAVIWDWSFWFEDLADVLERPAFVPPVVQSTLGPGFGLFDWLTETRDLARRMGIAVEVCLHDGDPERALTMAMRTTELGARLTESNNTLMTYLVGNSATMIGLRQVRRVATSKSVTADMLRPALGDIVVEDRLRAGIVRGLGQEFRLTLVSLEEMKDPHVLAEDVGIRLPTQSYRMAKLSRAPMPLVKTNMSRNVLGDFLSDGVRTVDRYERDPFAPEGGLFRTAYMTDEMNWFHFVRNPIGDSLITMLAPAMNRILAQHHKLVADVRMTQVCVALRCHFEEHGRLPDALDELAPEYFERVPIDPLTEQPFNYEPHADVPRVWSPGPNLEPDNLEDTWDCSDDLIIELTFAIDQQ